MDISGESSAAFMSIRGYYVPEKWRVYWTIRSACIKAYSSMQPGQLAYGEAAFGFIPRSYLLPQQYWLWRSHLLASGSPADAKWVLKANIHRGKGVSVAPQHQALSQALMHTRDPGSSIGSHSNTVDGATYHNILVQQYLEPQLVIAGRSSYLRLWLLVTSVSPLRAYLFKGGFAIFGKQKGSSSSSSNMTAAAAAAAGNSAPNTSSSGSSTDDLIVNLWIQDREKSPIWSLQQLEQYLDKHPEIVQPLPAEQQQQQQQQQRRRTFADAWSDMQRSASLVLAAALPAVRQAAANASAPPQGTFEYFGLDFVLDAHLRPWLLEVNAIPSMARRKKGACVGGKATASCQLKPAQAGGNSSSGTSNSSSSSSSSSSSKDDVAAADDFDEQKEQFVHDMLVLLGLPVDPPAAAAAAAAAAWGQAGSAPAEVDGLALLRKSAAAAAAAGIRSSNSSSNSSSSGARMLLQQCSAAAHDQPGAAWFAAGG
ncbi:hypothetical protein COO60DRAFT_1646502 [Scenedesmus sp. NREL 46B-D3]|nr:hypothetical protein COO60DRAFT_1646502 [Scenedesmus sp. NREL 46B-D3]